MGYITIAILALTAVALGFGALFGMLRGRNRAILRLILVVISAVLAILLRGVIVDVLLGIEIDGQSLQDTVASSMNTGDMQLPTEILNLVFALIEIIIGLVAYFILFFVIRIITWIIVFPICKIWVKKGEKKRKGWGALVGLIQGLIVAFVVLSPMTNLVVQVDKISSVKIGGEQIFELPEEIGLHSYVESVPGKAYTALGGWYFNMITSANLENGSSISIDDTVEIMTTVTQIADSVDSLTQTLGAMADENATPEDRVNAMAQAGDALIEMGNKIDGLNDSAKQVIDDMLSSITELLPDDPESQEMAEMFENLSIEDLNVTAVGEAIKGVSSLMDKVMVKETPEAVTQEDVGLIVSGLAGSDFILDILPTDGEPFIPVPEMDDEWGTDLTSKFETAVNNITDQEVKTKLQSLFGLN